MKYEVRWTETSIRQLKKLDKKLVRRIVGKMEFVSRDPFLHVQKLKGFDFYRVRVGDYRLIVSIEKRKMIVFVLEVGHRRAIYRGY
jgi:mRNA interferase RelE/StbE